MEGSRSQYPGVFVKNPGETRRGSVKDREKDEPATIPTASTQVKIGVAGGSTFATPLGPIDESESEDSDDSDDNTQNDNFDPLPTIEKLLPDKHSNNLPLEPLTESSRAEFVASLAADFKDLNLEEHNQQVTQNGLLSHAVTRETSSESEQKSKLWSLNRKLNNISATEPDYETATKLLNLDPDCPKFGKVILRPWQVTGAAWMAMQEESTIKGGIIGDEGGLGKTIQSLNLICHRADTGCAPFYPTLIVAPSPLVDAWFRAARRFHDKFTILLFYGYVDTRKTTYQTKKYQTKRYRTKKDYMVNWDMLNECLESLSSNDSQTGRTLVITSYKTFVGRTFEKVVGTAPLQPGHDNGRHSFSDDNEDVDKELSKADEFRKAYKTIWRHRLERVILDEGHTVKNILTQVHQSIAQCPINCRWIVTATSMLNHTRDMRGFLSLLFRPEWKDSLDPREGPNFVKIYAMCDAQNEKSDLHLLDPELFRRTFSRGNLPEKDALIVLPRILRKLQLRRCIGSCMQVLGKTIVIGEEIPPYRIKTIEVVMSTVQQKEYNDIHRSLTTNLKRGGAVVVTDQQAEDMGGCYDMRVYRRLRHASFAFGLERLYKSTTKREGNLAKHIVKWKATPGGDLIWLLSQIMQCKPSSIPLDRSFIAKHMINTSPKFPALLAIANKVVIQDKKPLLVFLSYPLPQFQTISFLRAFGFNVHALSSGMVAQEKSKVVKEFNLGKIEILVVTYATCLVGFNFHYKCSDVVFLEPAFSINTILRAIGRVHRFEQEREQNIWIVSAAHTFDRFVEFSQARKIIPQIIGTGAESFSDLDTGLGLEDDGWGDDEDFDNERDDNEKSLRSRLLEERTDEMLQELLGQPSSRLEFHDKEDLGLSLEAESAIERLANEGETGNMEAEEAEEVEEVEEEIRESGEVGNTSSKGVDCERNDKSISPGAIYEMDRSQQSSLGSSMGMSGSGSLMKGLESRKRKAKDFGLSESEPMGKRCHSV